MLRAMPWNYELFIDGKWTSEGATGTIDVIDPATEEVIGSVPEASVGTAQRAIEAARTAFDTGPWPWTKPEERAAKLIRLDLPCIDVEARPYFNDVLDHVRRVQAMVDGLREVLTSVFEFSNLLEQQRTGAITRQLAAWAAILAVPTAIAGIYGMNFEHMPELDSPYGYWVVLAVIAAVCAGLYVRFKRARWL